MRKIFLYIVSLFIIPFSVNAQELEAGIVVGGANYFGDLAPRPVLGETNLAYGVFGRLNFSSSFAFTATIMQATVSGNDKNFAFNNDRNLNFHTDILEYAALVEFNFFKYGMRPVDKKFSPFVFLGISIFEYNPQTSYLGNTIDLRNIQTEDVSYGTISYGIPFGMGIKYQFKHNYALEATFGLRKTFTDYLDDVSSVYPDLDKELLNKGVLAAQLSDRSQELHDGVFQNKLGYRRGNSDFNDWYMFFTLTVAYRFNKVTRCGRFL